MSAFESLQYWRIWLSAFVSLQYWRIWLSAFASLHLRRLCLPFLAHLNQVLTLSRNGPDWALLESAGNSKRDLKLESSSTCGDKWFVSLASLDTFIEWDNDISVMADSGLERSHNAWCHWCLIHFIFSYIQVCLLTSQTHLLHGTIIYQS